jgi:multisubunit Na+/H+ antiporter MnhB subunit
LRRQPRRFGQSKYGFSRIYKVFLDLLAISTILGFHRRPMAGFAALAVTASGIALVSLASAVAYAITAPHSPGIVFSGLAVLSGALAIFLLFLGLLSQLIYSTMARRFDPFRRLAARIVQEPPAAAGPVRLGAPEPSA